MTLRKVRLTRSGWTATIKSASCIYLDYEGIEWRRSQSVIRYHNGRNGYDWPEVVPSSVKSMIDRLFDRLADEGE